MKIKNNRTVIGGGCILLAALLAFGLIPKMNKSKGNTVKVVGNTLWKYEVIDNVYDDSGKIIKVKGRHVRKNDISPALAARLKYGGAAEADISKFKK